MASQPQQVLSASDRLIAAQLEAEKQEPKVPVMTQIRELKDPENHMNPWVRKMELARLTGKPMPKGRGRPAKLAVGDYGCENLDIEEELDHSRHDETAYVGNIDFGAMAEELENEDDDDAEDTQSRPPTKRKRHPDGDDLHHDSPAPPAEKKQPVYRHPDCLGNIVLAALNSRVNEEEFDDAQATPFPPPKKRKHQSYGDDLHYYSSAPRTQEKQPAYRHPDYVGNIDFAALNRELNEEASDEAGCIPAASSKKRKRHVDEDDLAKESSATPPRKKQSTDRRKITKYCGIHSPSLHDPPLQPKKGGYPAAGAIQYHCPRCDVALSRPDTVRKHFEKCIELNGNPDALKWTDYREVARTPEESLAEANGGKTGKPTSNVHLPTPASSPEQVPAPAPAPAPTPVSSSLPVACPSPAAPKQAQQLRQPKAQKQLTAVCGVYSPSLNDPPIQPPSYRSNQNKNRYHCPRCDYALSVADSVRKHFLSCIDKNGNPDALKWTDYTLDPLDHVADGRTQGPATQHASSGQETIHKPSPMSLSTAAKRKQREDDDIDQTYDESHQPQADAGRTDQKRQKRIHQTQNANNKNKGKKPVEMYAGLTHSPSEGMYPTTNPHPFFARAMQPWEAPRPGWLKEVDMCTWQKRPGNTIPLHVELAWMRGEIFSIAKSRWIDPDYEEKEKKKLEEQMAARKKREEDEAFLAQFEVKE